MRRGRLFVISGPSGVGKGTVVRALLAAHPDLAFSVSATTRAPRPGEIDGVHYRFVTEDDFARMVADRAFLEHAQVFGRHYGTLEADVQEARDAGRDILLEVDVQGARDVRERVPDAVLVFLEPPSEEELRRRLASRGTETDEGLERRLAEARIEMAEASWFDHRIVNDQVNEAVAEVLAIIEAQEGAHA